MQATIYNQKAESMEPDEAQATAARTTTGDPLYRAYRNVAFYHSASTRTRSTSRASPIWHHCASCPSRRRRRSRKSYPYGMFAVPLKEIVRIYSSGGGTVEQPLVVGFTRTPAPLDRVRLRCVLTAAGVNEQDVIQFSLDCQHSSAASGFQQGAEQIGASVVRASGCSSTLRQVTVMRHFKTSGLVCSPHHASATCHHHDRLGREDRPNAPEEDHHCRRPLDAEDAAGDRVAAERRDFRCVRPGRDHGPGRGGRMALRCGLHINEDHASPKWIDPHTLQPLAEGLRGELVLTTITKEGFPLIRYRTGDLTSLASSPCLPGERPCTWRPWPEEPTTWWCSAAPVLLPAQLPASLNRSSRAAALSPRARPEGQHGNARAPRGNRRRHHRH